MTQECNGAIEGAADIKCHQCWHYANTGTKVK